MSDLRVIELEQQLERRDAFITELEIEINNLKKEICAQKDNKNEE